MLSCLCGPTYEAHLDSDEERAKEFVNKLRFTEKNGNALKAELQGMIQANGWREYFQEAMMKALKEMVEAGGHMGPIFEKAYHEAMEKAMQFKEFADNHKVLYWIVAIGILAIMAPWVLEALGFAESGILEGMTVQFWMILAKCWE